MYKGKNEPSGQDPRLTIAGLADRIQAGERVPLPLTALRAVTQELERRGSEVGLRA